MSGSATPPTRSSAVAECASFRAGFAHGEVWLLADGQRRKLGEAVAVGVHDTGAVKVAIALSRFVLVGVKRGQKRALQVFDAKLAATATATATAAATASDDDASLALEATIRHRGFGALRELSNGRDGTGTVLVACGRGMGVAHVWKFTFSAVADSEGGRRVLATEELGRVSAKSHTIAAMTFSPDGRALVTVTADDIAQVWRIGDGVFGKLSSGKATIVRREQAALEQALGDAECARALLLELAHDPHADEWIKSSRARAAPEWASLFPPRLLNPDAYDGDEDEHGRPHGHGVQRLPGSGTYSYDGEWRHGRRHGRGQVVDERTDSVIYVGGWRNDERHGFGLEIKTGSPEVGQVYEGWWRNDVWQGLGKLHLSKAHSGLPAESTDVGRICYTGFFRHGKQHGLGWWTWPEGSPLLPCTGDMRGSIRCIVQFKDGRFFNEFNFHRVDHDAIPDADRDRFTFAARAKDKFAFRADGRWEGSECWACMRGGGGSSAGAETWLVCANSACRARVHVRCLGRTTRRHVLWDRARSLFCDADNGTYNNRPPAATDGQSWFCPMDACQDLALRSLVEQGRKKMRPGSSNDNDNDNDDKMLMPLSEAELRERLLAASGGPRADAEQALKEQALKKEAVASMKSIHSGPGSLAVFAFAVEGSGRGDGNGDGDGDGDGDGGGLWQWQVLGSESDVEDMLEEAVLREQDEVLIRVIRGHTGDAGHDTH